MINACKLRNVENIGDLAIFIQETKNQTLEPPELIQINAILGWKGKVEKCPLLNFVAPKTSKSVPS